MSAMQSMGLRVRASGAERHEIRVMKEETIK